MPRPSSGASPIIAATDDARRCLLELARASLAARLEGATQPDLPQHAVCECQVGVFVTVMRDGELRACLGHAEGHQRLGELIRQLAAAVVTDDPRFEEITPDELPSLQIELSLLTPPRLGSLEEIDLGRHGIILRHATRSALLLPQVAISHALTVTQFLDACAHKAGLPPGAWREVDVELEIFEAEVFAE